MPITLDPSVVEHITQGSTPIETNDAVASVAMAIDFTDRMVTVTFKSGTPSDNTFTPGERGDSNWTSINMDSGAWTSSLGGSGTLTAPQLATMNGNLKNARNGAEALANLLGVFPGTMVAWT
jgi:hypothetical protein